MTTFGQITGANGWTCENAVDTARCDCMCVCVCVIRMCGGTPPPPGIACGCGLRNWQAATRHSTFTTLKPSCTTHACPHTHTHMHACAHPCTRHTPGCASRSCTLTS
jgi:hypothetical protein